jgi:diketogulonate reductase-like aldo/keto reductase
VLLSLFLSCPPLSPVLISFQDLSVLTTYADTGYSYKNEEEVGSALHQWLANNPKVTREDIFITTKVWPHMLKPEDVEISLDESLRKLGVEYVDAFLIHWPFAVERTEDYQVKMNDDGKVRQFPSKLMHDGRKGT